MVVALSTQHADVNIAAGSLNNAPSGRPKRTVPPAHWRIVPATQIIGNTEIIVQPLEDEPVRNLMGRTPMTRSNFVLLSVMLALILNALFMGVLPLPQVNTPETIRTSGLLSPSWLRP